MKVQKSGSVGGIDRVRPVDYDRVVHPAFRMGARRRRQEVHPPPQHGARARFFCRVGLPGVVVDSFSLFPAAIAGQPFFPRSWCGKTEG